MQVSKINVEDENIPRDTENQFHFSTKSTFPQIREQARISSCLKKKVSTITAFRNLRTNSLFLHLAGFEI